MIEMQQPIEIGITNWETVRAIVGVFGIYTLVIAGLTYWTVKFVAEQSAKAISSQFAAVDFGFKELRRKLDENARANQDLKEEFYKHQIAIQKNYVSRNDQIHRDATLNGKIDSLAVRIDHMLEKKHA